MKAFVISIILGIGFIAGHYTTIMPFKVQIVKFSQSETLGKLLRSAKKKKDIAVAYYERDIVVDQMDNFSWAVPNIVSPFVGNGPMPGKHDNAYINSV